MRAERGGLFLRRPLSRARAQHKEQFLGDTNIAKLFSDVRQFVDRYLPHLKTRAHALTKGRLLAHPPEPSYPCYVSVLGELAKLVPREEPPQVYR